MALPFRQVLRVHLTSFAALLAGAARALPVGAPPAAPDASSLGLTLGLDDDIRVDTGARLGLNAAAPDLALFVGGSARY